MDLQLSFRTGRGCTVVSVAGELDMDTGPQLQDYLLGLVDDGVRLVVLDFAGVPFMDSSGLGLLVATMKVLKDKNGSLCLAAPQEPIRTVMAYSAVDQVVTIYDTVAEAEEDTCS